MTSRDGSQAFELSATDAGKPVYEKPGFVRKQSRYTGDET